MARHLITSALPYVNGVKHLGNLVGSMLPADVYARFLRARGESVLFICATDEHGTPAELAAVRAGMPVDEYCREQHARQRDLGEAFALSWDHFGRSSSPENHDLTRHFAARLEAAGYLDVRATDQVYSPSEARYLPDRYVTGTCPRCAYPKARGDQCESCGALLDPTDLIEPRSTITGATDLELRSTRHIFLRQSLFQDTLRRWISTKHDWPTLTTSIARKWLDEGLHDRCITRDLAWGVPVDRPGMEGKVFYVWFDAPIEYIAATQEWANRGSEMGEPRDWKSWWYDAPDVTYTQFMAKDNIPFHTLSFPCTLIGSGEPWKLPDYIKGFNWLTYYGGKFSTSDGTGVFMDDALDLLPADYWRWFLIANAPETTDASFTWTLFGDAVNKDLADNLGNFVNRTLTFSTRHFGPEVPPGGQPGPVEHDLSRTLKNHIDAYTAALTDLHFRRAAQRLRAIWSLGNQYLDQTAPWRQITQDRHQTAVTMRTAINLIRTMAILSAPIIPTTAHTILTALGTDATHQPWPTTLTTLPPGSPFTVPPILFTKLSPDHLQAWQTRFSGTT